MDTLFQDLRFGIRLLLKNPGFSGVAVLALALGIGANTAIFSVVNSVLLRPLPYAEPDRLFELREVKLPEHPDFPVTPATFLDWQNQSATFAQIGAYLPTSVNVSGATNPERLRAAQLSAGFIGMLGVNPARGRDFLPEEDQPGQNSVAIISHRLWQRQFAADPEVLSRTIKLNDKVYTIVGVMPPKFAYPETDTDIWIPMAFDADDRQAYGAHYLSVLGRLNPGATIEQARADMSGIAESLAEQHPDMKRGWTVNVVSMLDYAVSDTRPALLVLLGAVAFVLLIACANVANLMLARGAGRQKEIAIRTALGSSRWRIARQLLTESVLLAVVGGAAGLLLAVWGVAALLAVAPKDLPRLNDVSIDTRVLLFTIGITLLTGLVFGLIPALQTSKPDLNKALKETGRGVSEGIQRHRLRNALVVAELALSLMLLIGGGLLIRSFWRLQHVNPGFNTASALTIPIALPRMKYAKPSQKNAFFSALVDKVSQLPGAETVAIGNVLPIVNDFILGVVVEGEQPALDTERPKTRYSAVSPGYFKAMGIPVIAGRTFTQFDKADAKRVVVINQTMAARLFPNGDAIGKRIHITMGEQVFREIVGIVGDVKHKGLDKATLSQTYEPFAQEPSSSANLVVRTSVPPASLVGAIRSEVLSLDRDQPIGEVKTLDQIVSESVGQQRFTMILMCTFAAVAFVLAAVGLYGVMSYSVAQRTHEIGVRMALGAKQTDVLRMVVRQVAGLTLGGIALGLGAAFAVTRLMAKLLFEVNAVDPLTFAAVAVFLAAVAMAASFIPARRATKVDPMVALRYE
ncbi:MAG TPA: ABC transporter permease [Blastocatellia bacterium]|nr:ABC transporter permease [Blastocatellia bacterium]